MSEIPPRLRWACRRGMLELDVLLGNFLEQAYASLTQHDQAIFEKCLACNDQELFEWLTRKKISQDPDIQFMVEKILEHARHKH